MNVASRWGQPAATPRGIASSARALAMAQYRACRAGSVSHPPRALMRSSISRAASASSTRASRTGARSTSRFRRRACLSAAVIARPSDLVAGRPRRRFGGSSGGHGHSGNIVLTKLPECTTRSGGENVSPTRNFIPPPGGGGHVAPLGTTWVRPARAGHADAPRPLDCTSSDRPPLVTFEAGARIRDVPKDSCPKHGGAKRPVGTGSVQKGVEARNRRMRGWRSPHFSQ